MSDKPECGSVQKVREAVKAVVDVGYPHNFQHEAPHIRGYCYDITRAIHKCFAALSAPPRNCDVGTADEQAERFRKFCKMDYISEDCPDDCPLYNDHSTIHCPFAWAQMPYEKE